MRPATFAKANFFKRGIYWVTLCFAVFSCQLATQQVSGDLRLRETRGVRDVLEDYRGHLWFSTPDYVAQWDGESMDYFGPDEGLLITGNLHESEDGILWIENGRRVFQYDGTQFNEIDLDGTTSAGEL